VFFEEWSVMRGAIDYTWHLFDNASTQ